MTIDELLSRLDMVKPRGPSRWTAKCPSHSPDRHPSLQVTQGEKATLLKCWGGCSLEQITEALQIPINDLFYDHYVDPRQWQEQKRQRERERVRQEEECKARGRRLDALREADAMLRSVESVDTNTLTEQQLDDLLSKIGDALNLLESERYDG